MPQNGFHGLFGLATARAVAPRIPRQFVEPAVVGIVLGSMLPDIDMYPTGVAYLMGHSEMVEVIHRGATHSLLAVLTLVVAGLLVKKWRWGALGLALGVSTHLLLDVFFWFKGVNIFWPFSQFDSRIPIVNLWTHEQLTPLWTNFREAFEFAAFALYLASLRRISARQNSSGWERTLWMFFALGIVTSFLFRRHEGWQHYLVTTPYLLAFLPYCWIETWRCRQALAEWAAAPIETPRGQLS